MKPIRILFCFLFIIQTSIAQQIICSAEDKQAFENKIIEIDGLLENDFGTTITSIGKTFLGTPYVAKTLEVGETESLVINLHGLDCTTFVENVLTFGQLLKNEKSDFSDFTSALQTVRYKNGVLNGYSSRLHYFTDWIVNNQSKNLVKDITNDLGGIALKKEINFMGSHRDLYPFLTDDKNYAQILKTEEELNKKELCILPQNQIEAAEYLMQSGDIIALATSIKGLDVTHTGFALEMPNGRIHLLHASSSGEVKISKIPLVDYLKEIKNNTGILVARPL